MIRRILLPVWLFWLPLPLALMSGCNRLAEPALANEPAISDNATVRLASQSPALRRLVTAPVTAAADQKTSWPARLAWDEDHTSRIAPPVAGRVTQASARIGETVQAGQSLATLVSAELGTAQADAAQAHADFEQARRNLARSRDLSDAGVVPAKEFEQAQADWQRSQAENQRAVLRLKSLGAGGAVDERLTLRSPIAGVVTERNINPGMEWRPDAASNALFVVSDPSYLWCWIDVPESAIASLALGDAVTVRSGAAPQERTPARIEFVGYALDPVSRTLKARASLRNPQHRLKSEMYVTVESEKKVANPWMAVPAKAVFSVDGAQQVFVKTDEGQFSRRAVDVVGGDADTVQVRGGVALGEEVVVDGALYLQQWVGGARPPASTATAEASSPPKAAP